MAAHGVGLLSEDRGARSVTTDPNLDLPPRPQQNGRLRGRLIASR